MLRDNYIFSFRFDFDLEMAFGYSKFAVEYLWNMVKKKKYIDTCWNNKEDFFQDYCNGILQKWRKLGLNSAYRKIAKDLSQRIGKVDGNY